MPEYVQINVYIFFCGRDSPICFEGFHVIYNKARATHRIARWHLSAQRTVSEMTGGSFVIQNICHFVPLTIKLGVEDLLSRSYGILFRRTDAFSFFSQNGRCPNEQPENNEKKKKMSRVASCVTIKGDYVVGIDSVIRGRLGSITSRFGLVERVVLSRQTTTASLLKISYEIL